MSMLHKYIAFLLSKALYTVDEDGVVVGNIPGYQGYYSQGENFEEARENLRDAIEGVMTIKILKKDTETLASLRAFVTSNQKQYV